MEATKVDLRIFLDARDPRGILRKPWRDGEFVYATNGKIGARVLAADYPEIGPVEERGYRPPKIASIFAKAEEERELLAPLPTLPVTKNPKEWCEKCRSTGWIVECSDCDGLGVETCDKCHAESNCHSCRGNGFRPCYSDTPKGSICSECGGDGIHPTIEEKAVEATGGHIGIRIGAELCDVHLLLLIWRLPGLQIVARPKVSHYEPLLFRFEGGDGIFMPLVRNADLQDEVNVEG